MRALLILALLSVPAFAERPRPTFIDVGMKVRPPLMAPPSSKIIFMHRCPPAGCIVNAGANDDSRQNISQIADNNTTIGAFTQSDDTWKKMLSCVRATFAPFDVMVTDVDPGPMTSHYEHIVGGKPSQLRSDIGGAGGVAPATCTEIPNAMSFTFDVYGDRFEDLCWTASQEVAHAFGLEHELNAKDPLTYLEGFLPKRFQAANAQCGEGIPRVCKCTTSGMQNTYEHILAMFGPGTPTPPMLTVKAPANGKTVQPGFVTRVDASDDSGMDHVEILVDGMKIAESFEEPYTIVAPDVVEQGPHVLEVRAVDIQGTPTSEMRDIIMGPPCTASAGCTGTDVCLAGVCTPGPDAPGGLGYECSANTECLSRNCLKTDGSFGHCVEQCNPAIEGVCPEGFDCIDAGGGAGVCLPNDSGGGCCDAGGSGRGAALLTFGVLALVLRRRRGR